MTMNAKAKTTSARLGICLSLLLSGPLLGSAGCKEEDPAKTEDPGSGTEMPRENPGPMVRLLAGMGTVGAHDGVGTQARFNGPLGLAISSPRGEGPLYVADTANHTIRRVDPQTGRTATVAGGAGQAGSADGDAMAARFNGPRGLALSPDGKTLYIVDSDNYTIRALETGGPAGPAGAVRTLAGSPGQKGEADGAAARFGAMGGAALHPGGEALYIADRGNHTIRRLDLRTGQVSTLVGTAGQRGHSDGAGARARFSGPAGLAMDPAGKRLFVADTSNHVIRQIDLEAGALVSTLAGSPGRSGAMDGVGAAARLAFPQGITTDGVTIFVSGLDGTVRRLDIATGRVTTLAGASFADGSRDGVGTQARIGDSFSLVLTPAALYVADRAHSNLRRIRLTDGEVITVAGAPEPVGSRDGVGSAARFSSPVALAADPSAPGGVYYVADTGNHLLRRVNAGSGEVVTLAGAAGSPGHVDGPGAAARFNAPGGVAFAAGRLYVSEQEGHVIRQVELDPVRVATLSGAGEAGHADGPGERALFDMPRGVAVDEQGRSLYVADEGNHVIRRVRLPDGVTETLVGAAGEAGLRDGALGTARLRAPAGLALSGRYLYVADRGNRVIRRVDLMAGEVSTLAGGPGELGAVDGSFQEARFRTPMELALGPSGNDLYVTDSSNHAIRRLDLGVKGVRTYVGELGQGAGLLAPAPLPGARIYAPQGLAIGPAGLVYSAENALYLAPLP
jgi:sugar lactone lactonase YvrE